MTSLIKFPSFINPARVTVQLIRTDEIQFSPVTNIQQVNARGNPAWRWTYEFSDLSLNERDVVEAFLMRCKGSVNTFKVTDPADYEMKAGLADWTDVYSGYGSFNVSAGSDTNKVNSWFYGGSFVRNHITDERTLRMEFYRNVSGSAVRWGGEGAAGRVSSISAGNAYVQRAKFFQMPERAGGGVALIVGSGSDISIGAGPVEVRSSDVITAPFVVGAQPSSFYTTAISARVNTGTTKIGDHFEVADYELKRCALVVNSENLLTYSNNFGHANWSIVNATISSGWMDADPTGVTSGGWKLFGDTSVNTRHYIEQTYTKPMTEDLYTVEVYAQADEYAWLYVEMRDNGLPSSVGAFFNTLSGYLVNSANESGIMRQARKRSYDVGSGTIKCALSGIVSSLNNVTVRVYGCSSDGNLEYTNNGSFGLNVFGANLRKHPLSGPYVPTTDTIVVGSGWQTGSKIVAAGFDPGDIVKAGQRFEIVNRFNNNSSDLFERSEFKRVTREVIASREGWTNIEFDPPIRNAPVTDRSWRTSNHLGETMHNPLIFHKPEMKARLLAGTIQYIEKPLQMTDMVFDVIEDMTR